MSKEEESQDHFLWELDSECTSTISSGTCSHLGLSFDPSIRTSGRQRERFSKLSISNDIKRFQEQMSAIPESFKLTKTLLTLLYASRREGFKVNSISFEIKNPGEKMASVNDHQVPLWGVRAVLDLGRADFFIDYSEVSTTLRIADYAIEQLLCEKFRILSKGDKPLLMNDRYFILEYWG
jgi:hypothetical protein